MRKFAGIFMAAALVLPAAVLVGQPAGAAGGTSCSKGSGTATFTPPLPKLGSKTKVKDVLKSKGTVGGCTGAVKSATLSGVSPKSTGSNCTTTATFTKTPTKVALTVKWNAGKPSVVAALLNQIKGKPATIQNVTGKVTSGQFKGMKVTGKITYKIPAGQCVTKPLSNVTYTDTGAFSIK